jgi:hypothetical membrane protein
MQPVDRSSLIRRLAIASLAGQLIWFAGVTVAGLFEPGYRELRDPVSALGANNAAEPWIFNLLVAIWGASFIAAAAALWLEGPGGWRGRLGPALIALTGLAQILAGFPFPADCRTTLDTWCEAQELAGDLPWRHYAHIWAYLLGSLALLLSVFAMAWRFRGDRRWGAFAPLALLAGLIAVAIVVGLFFVAGDDGAGEGNYGLAQRCALAAGGFWVAVLSVGLLVLRPGGGLSDESPEPTASTPQSA